MATSSVQVMPELWNELHVARDQRDRCAQDVEALKQACATGCGQRHVVECPDCYVKVLERMRSRYMDSSDREWFSQRGAFLQEMDDLFADAQQRQVSLRTIEASIESEKEAWYRWVLRRHPGFLEVSNDGPPMDEMRGMLDDPDRSRDELVAMMWQGVGRRNNWSDQVEEFLAKLATVGNDRDAIKKLYTSEFFLERNSNVALKFARPLLDIYTASVDGNKVLDTILTKILQDNQINRSTQPQRDNQIRRLDELRRAKTAVEQKRMRSKVPPVTAELFNLPPCKSCRRSISPDDVISCSLCQVAVQRGIKGQLTVYCSDDCYQESQERHVEESHQCAAGDQCLQDEDTDMDASPVLCNGCMHDRKVTLYCSEQCAAARLQEHSQREHGNANVTMTALDDIVDKVMTEENEGLTFK